MDADDRAVQLYTLEYEKAADRYDNIYRSMWTIFSYLTAVAAGLLAFGSDKIEPHALVSIAAIPLLFWFWTTYLPLDRYGNGAAKRLREIEGLLNASFNTQLNHFTSFAHELSVVAGMARAIIKLYQHLPRPQQAGIGHRVFATLAALWDEIRRARSAIFVIFTFLHFLVYCEAKVFRNSGQPLFREKPAAATVVGPAQNVRITGSSK